MNQRTRRLIAASAVSAAVVLAAPIMGKVTGLLRSAFPTRFVVMVGAVVAAAVMTAIVTAALRITGKRGARYGALLAALAIGIGYSMASSSGSADQDAVERFHFVEYGGVTMLFYRAWRERGDASAFVLPVLAALLVGTLDEWLQWFVPVRVGELRDVLLNLVAICCGLLVGVAIEPPEAFSKPLRPGSLASMCAAGAAAVLVLAGFLSTVHLGYLVNTEKEIGSLFPGDLRKKTPDLFFRSHYTAAQLGALAGDRTTQWRTDPPAVLKRYSREDQYMDEGLWHIRKRNADWAAGEYLRAWNENLILERFFTPVLDTPSYALPSGGRWPNEQRADAAARARDGGPQPIMGYVSDAQPYPIFIWPKPLFWSVISAAVVGLLAWAWRIRT